MLKLLGIRSKTGVSERQSDETVEKSVQVIEPRPGWRAVDFGELWQYRDLFYFMVWRDVKARYAQSVFGIGWAVFQPLAMMVVFTVVFGNLAKFDSDGVPYQIFSYAALVPWAFFSNSLTDAAQSLTRNREMLTKIYMPRLIMPLSAVLAKLVDFFIALVILGGMMAWYGIVPTWSIFALPLLVVLMALTGSGIGMFFTALSVQYRDFNHAARFGVQLLMYAAPVVYPLSSVPEQYRLIYAINPMVGVIEGFRAALIGTTEMPWDIIGIGTITMVVALAVGAAYFKRMERIFADVA